MSAPLLAHIRRFISLTQEEEGLLCSLLQTTQLKNKDHLLSAGQVCDAYYFVVQGVLRMYATTDKGNEHIVQFGIDNWWICDYN